MCVCVCVCDWLKKPGAPNAEINVSIFIHSFIHLLYMKPTDNHDIEDINIISVVGSLAIAGQISLLSNAIKLHKNKM